jgi:hypothetical protein
MTWPIGTSVSRAKPAVREDMVDLALDSTRLKRENAELRRQLAEKESLLANARDTNVEHAARILTLERVLRELCQDALKHPHWPLLRWVRFGPMANVIEQFKNGKL